MSTKLTTGKVRFSYATLFEPKASNPGDDLKYSVALLIPKSDTATVNKIRAAIAAAREAFVQKNGSASLPANPVNPLHDGDGVKPNSGEPYGDECKGCWVMNASSKQKPLIIDGFKNEITDPAELYSGCYGRASINFYGYSNKRKGIGCGLLGVQKLSDGEPLGGNMASVDDFDDGYSDGGADDLLG
jgi:hypothetical protein